MYGVVECTRVKLPWIFAVPKIMLRVSGYSRGTNDLKNHCVRCYVIHVSSASVENMMHFSHVPGCFPKKREHAVFKSRPDITVGYWLTGCKTLSYLLVFRSDFI